MKRKKIAFVIGSLSQGGAERVISTLANELIKRYDVAIITFKNKEPFYKLHPDIKLYPCKEKIEVPKNLLESLKLNYQLVKTTAQILKKEQVDVSIGFITAANIITILASKLIGIPRIISERNNPMRENVPKFWVILRKYVYPKANFVVLQTNGIKKFYKNKIKDSKTIILPNPISKNLSNLRSEHDKKMKVILSVGRLDKNKCHDLLIRAFSEIKNDDWQLQILGDGDYKPTLEELIQKLNLGKKVTLISATSDISTYYNSAKIFAFTSRTEGFPNALLEAMHFGLPCISTDCPFGPSDLISSDENGYLIPMNDIDLLKYYLQKLMTDEELCIMLGEAAKKSTNKYMVDNVIDRWQDVIENALSASTQNRNFQNGEVASEHR